MLTIEKEVYNLSLKFSPPKYTIRDAFIMDGYGDTTGATRPIKHQRPEDVSREDLDFYPMDFAHLSLEPLLFYFYPVAFYYSQDNSLECIDSFLYSLNCSVKREITSLSEKDLIIVKEGLKWIYEAGTPDFADWDQCPNLNALRES